MAKKTSTVPVPPAGAQANAGETPVRKTYTTKASQKPEGLENRVAFGKLNWYLFFAGVGLLALGFIVMTIETAEYGFGTLGLTVGPLLLAAAFVVEFFAVMYRPKTQQGS